MYRPRKLRTPDYGLAIQARINRVVANIRFEQCRAKGSYRSTNGKIIKIGSFVAVEKPQFSGHVICLNSRWGMATIEQADGQKMFGITSNRIKVLV